MQRAAAVDSPDGRGFYTVERQIRAYEWRIDSGRKPVMIFITQGNYTQHAVAGMLERPEDRSVETEKLMASVGAKVLGYYFTFGQFDFILIGEAKNEKVWMSALIVGAAGGGLSNLTTTVAVTPAQAKQAFTSAKGLRKSFRAAGDK